MAGERPLPVQEAQDEQQIIVIGPMSSATTQQYVLWVAERDTVIDGASIFGALQSTVDTVNAVLYRGVYTATSEDTLGEMLAANRPITGAINIGDAGEENPVAFGSNWTVLSTQNHIPAGGWVILALSAAPTAVGPFCVRLRVRSKVR